MTSYDLHDNEVEVVNIRLVKEPSLYSTEPITTPEDVLRVVAKELATYDREVFAVLNLKTNGQVINLNICSMGTLYASMVSPREVKSSILSNAAAFICLHNHPSGNPEPSDEDIKATKRLMHFVKLLDIRLLDHVIVAAESGRMFSFRNEGILDQLDEDAPSQDWER